jgi:predicted small lipoprotein YifL
MAPLTIRRSMLLVLALLALALSACGVGGPTSAPDSGIRGLVTLGPTCPVQTENDPQPCSTTYAATLEIHDQATDELVTTVTSGADGRFEVRLGPGTYRIVPQVAEVLPIAGPVENVVVAAGRFTEVQVDFDSGIR